jgi:hypothetical protein
MGFFGGKNKDWGSGLEKSLSYTTRPDLQFSYTAPSLPSGRQ